MAIGQAAEDYFRNLFTTTRDAEFTYDGVFNHFNRRVTREMNEDLTRPVTEEEVRKAVFSIGPNKAPGPDGFTGAFYRQFWPTIKDQITQEVQQFFDNGILDPQINKTNLCLIPKIEVPRAMGDFRPISLCNVSYKIISKILVGRLKQHLPDIIVENQVAFIPGRNIIDNVIIAHEMLHSLKSRKRWAKSYMAVKTDISKAYDRLEWKFLEDTMIGMGFDAKWIGWIMTCVSTVSFSALINGSPTGNITPQRGIRQGDPLSPYLFIICSEVLSHLLLRATAETKLKGMKISTYGPTINHLLFADDALFFCHAHPRSCKTIQRILEMYEKASGQAVNLSKSAITFGSRVSDTMKTRLRTILNIHNDGGCGKYLGLPEVIGQKKKEIFNFILEKIKKRTKGWSNKYLSEAGKEILLKTIASAIPVYPMNVF